MMWIHKLAWWLLWIGGINWGLVGLGWWAGGADWNVVHMILGSWPMVEGAVYVLVGVSAILVLLKGKHKMMDGGGMAMGGGMKM